MGTKSRNKHVNASYIDGGIIMTVNLILEGSDITPFSIFVLESFVEAVVLYDVIVAAFNLLTPENKAQRQVEDFFEPKDVFKQFKSEHENELRTTNGVNSAIGYAMYRNDISKHILDFAKTNPPSSDISIILELRHFLNRKLTGYTNFVNKIPGEIQDMIKIARHHGIDFFSAPEWIPFYYPDMIACSVSKQLYR